MSEDIGGGKNVNIGDQLNALLGQVSMEEINKSPVFIKDNDALLKSMANDLKANPKPRIMEKKYEGRHDFLKNDLKVNGYGNFDVSHLSEEGTDNHKYFQDQPISDQFAASTIMGTIDHGRNNRIENMLANTIYPFPNLNVNNWDNRYSSAKEKILGKYKDPKFAKHLKIYAPFGYTENGVETPSGLPEHVQELTKAMGKTKKEKKALAVLFQTFQP